MKHIVFFLLIIGITSSLESMDKFRPIHRKVIKFKQRKRKQTFIILPAAHEYDRLQSAISEGDKGLSKLKQLLEVEQYDPNMSISDDPEYILPMPVYIATDFQNSNAIKLLIENKANINDKNPGTFFYYPLHLAINHGNLDIINILLKNNAQTDLLDTHDNSALAHAGKKYVQSCSLEKIKAQTNIMRALIFHGATFKNEQEKSMFSPFVQILVNTIHSAVREHFLKLLIVPMKITKEPFFKGPKEVAQIIVDFAYPQSAAICLHHPKKLAK